jgi:hypothetical protein
MPFLDVSEFNLLPPAGTIDPCRLRFAQPEISKDFADPQHGDVYKLATLLEGNPGFASNLPPLQIGEFGGMIWSFDSRRLVALQMARVKANAVVARYQKINAAAVSGRLDNFGAEGSRSGIVVGVRQGGKHSTRLEHRNPEYANVNLGPSLDMSTDEFKSGLRTISKLTGVQFAQLA